MQSSRHPALSSCSALPMLQDMKVNIDIYTHVYTPFTQLPTAKTIKNLAVVTLFHNDGPFSVIWPKSSNAEAVSAFALRSLEVRCKLMNRQST